jgi:hypothetical protein
LKIASASAGDSSDQVISRDRFTKCKRQRARAHVSVDDHVIPRGCDHVIPQALALA